MVSPKTLETTGIPAATGTRTVTSSTETSLLLRISSFWGVGAAKAKVAKSIRAMVVNCILKFGLVVGLWKSVRELW